MNVSKQLSENVSASPRPARGFPGVSASFQPAFRQHALSIAIIAAAIIALFWRVFFLGETLVDVATLNNQLPWGYTAGQSDYPYNRRDLTDMYVTREYFVVSAYRDGELPLWNPYTMAGHPIYADGVTRTFSPLLLFYNFFDVPLGYSLARVTELLLAAVFMYIFLIAIGVSPSGGLAGSLVFAFSAHSMLHLTGLGWWGGLMWLPLIMLFVDRAITRRSYTQAVIAGVFLAAQFFCGYMPNQIYYVGAIVFYYLCFALLKRDGSRKRAIIQAAALMSVTLAVGFALAATQWVPTLELLRHSNRRIVGSELSYIYLPPWYLATLVFPNLFGEAYDVGTLTLFTALNVSHDHILYLGIAALAPLGCSIYLLKSSDSKDDVQRRGAEAQRRRVFILLAAVSLVIMMAAPIYVPLTRFIPILNVIRVAVRAGVLFLFAACVLVAFGVDLLLKADRETMSKLARFARRFLIGAVAFAMIAIVTSYVMRETGFAVETGNRGWLAYLRRAALVLSDQFLPPNLGVIIPLALISIVALMLWLVSKDKMSRRVFFASLIALLVVDLFWASGQFNDTFERSRVFPQTQITDLLRSLEPGRVLVVPSGLETNRRASAQSEKIIAPPNTLLPYGIPTVAGKNQQFPRWYREYASLIEPQPNLSHVVFDKRSSPFFNLLNVRYVMTHASASPLEGYDLIASAEGISVYENKRALPRAFFAGRAIEVDSAVDSLNAMRDPAFDPCNDAVIERPEQRRSERIVTPASPHEFSSLSLDVSVSSKQGEARIYEDRRNRVVIETDSQSDGLLVLSDNYYPGWRAYVDGSEVNILRANHTMRAVRVPAGSHVVSFLFAPAAFWVSAYFSLASAVLVFVALSFSFVRHKRKLSRGEQSHDIQQDKKDD